MEKFRFPGFEVLPGQNIQVRGGEIGFRDIVSNRFPTTT
jgi:hypothetical protein